jgi:putative redox protein
VISAKAIWTDNERYVSEATSRHAIVMDTASEKTANSPMELVLIALCGCTASDVVGILRKKREPFTHLEVRAEGERASGYPAVYTEIKLVYRIGGKVSRKAAEDAVRLSKEKYCSVSAMLEKTAKITFTIEHFDEAGHGGSVAKP